MIDEERRTGPGMYLCSRQHVCQHLDAGFLYSLRFSVLYQEIVTTFAILTSNELPIMHL